MASEAGHEPNRVYVDQQGNLHLNGAQFLNDAEEDIAPALESLDQVSIAELEFLDGALAGTVVSSKAVVVDSNKDVGDIRNLDAVNIDAGASGTAGSVDVFPATVAKGKTSFTAADKDRKSVV